MGGDCPNEECHKKMEGYGRTLYGPDGDGGLVDCVRKCIKRPPVSVCVAIIGIVIGLAATAFGFVQNHGERIVALEQNTVSYRQSQRELKADMNKEFDELKAMIRDLRK
ncbi:MAG: hypothetical protein SVO01_00105 [Thermotogota bacterium]|nr:hypothetical protein [Thermotogota bacterium]